MTVSEHRKAQLRAADARYKAANREKLLARSKTARLADLPKAAARMKDYRARKPEVIAAIEARRKRPDGFREKFNAYRRDWAKQNRDKIREHAHKRAGKKVAALPRGTIRRLGELQRWRCASCSCDLRKSGYHKDHVMPLAQGGEHAAHNIQLLCPPCNLSKGAKHPIDFMQEAGKLL